jgi:hypothetical protein
MLGGCLLLMSMGFPHQSAGEKSRSRREVSYSFWSCTTHTTVVKAQDSQESSKKTSKEDDLKSYCKEVTSSCSPKHIISVLTSR